MDEQRDKIRVSAGEDLLAFIPHTVGYWPEASIVCIGMRGKQLRATMRLDLPPGEADFPPQAIAQMAAGQLSSDEEADGCLIAIFGREDWTVPENLPCAELFSALSEAFDEQGLPVVDAWFVGPGHWRSVGCRSAQCCPWPGKSIATIKNSFVNAEFIYRGSMVQSAPKEQIAQLIAVQDHQQAQAVAGRVNALSGELARCGTNGPQMWAILAAWEQCLQHWPTAPDPCMQSFLIASLGNVNVRDTIMVSFSSDRFRAMEGATAVGLLTSESGEILVPTTEDGECVIDLNFLEAGRRAKPSPSVGEGMDIFQGALLGGNPLPQPSRPSTGAGSPRRKDPARPAPPRGPDWGRMDTAELLLQFLARSIDGGDKVPLLCILGWIQWCKGRGTWAGHYFAACRAIRPDYSLAVLLDRLLAAGHVAAFAKDRRTAWRGGADNAPRKRGDSQAA